MTNICTMDPGGTTGLVFLHDYESKPSSRPSKQREGPPEPAHSQLLRAKEEGRIEVFEINCRDVLNGFADILGKLNRFRPDVVVYEGFELWTPAADLTPVEINILLRWEVREGFELVKQMPAERTVASPERLKRWGLWQPGKKDAMAAMQHMVVYLRKQYAKE